jgi:UDP-N-acetylglucosamine pyrophosphorylase
MHQFSRFEAKMRAMECSEAAISAFRNSYSNLIEGRSGMLPESAIEPVENLPRLEEIVSTGGSDPSLLAQTVVVKLNGGLGTSMGLQRAKSLLIVKEGLNFLDLIARQILVLRKGSGTKIRFLLMNSFSTSFDTLRFLSRYPDLGDPRSMEFMQSQAPKVDAATLGPVSWPQNPQLEWCPPGHGDLYPSLLASGLLDRYLEEGVRYLFVSNSDNLGATLDPGLLGYFAHSKRAFLMEVAVRTTSDRKGGHLAKRGGRLLLRESAQCPEADLASFQDINRHRFFNTNNLWIRLDALKEALVKNKGFVPLPLIKNSKTVDPRDKASPKVFQLETAMGAAIEYFDTAGAIVVPRSRFAPVKTTADLFALRSDAYAVTDDWQIKLAEERRGEPPRVTLDDHYRLVEQLDASLARGVPSLRACTDLTVNGPVLFGSDIAFKGKVQVSNGSSEARELPAGEYRDRDVSL